MRGLQSKLNIHLPESCCDNIDPKGRKFVHEQQLKTEMFQLSKGKEPETIALNNMLCLLKVASLFALQEIKM